MSIGAMRPRFRMTVSGKDDEQIALIESAAARPASGCVTRVLGNHVDITVVEEDRHRWSPCMQLEFRQDDDTVIPVAGQSSTAAGTARFDVNSRLFLPLP